MRKIVEILISSFKMAMEELRSNKLRTFLSLFGITIGIFCIIGVLATVNSLERNVQTDIKSLGSNSIYIDKWDYTGQIPYWKLMNRPKPTADEAQTLKKVVTDASNVAFMLQKENTTISFDDASVSGIMFYGVTEDFSNIQKIEVETGRYLLQSDFDRATNNVIMGYNVAEKLFETPERAVGKQMDINGRKVNIIGLIKKQGQSLIGGFAFDDCMITSTNALKRFVKEENASPVIIVQGKEEIPIDQLKDELTGYMRSIRKLRPTQQDDFSLNDINSFSDFASQIFSGINLGGWAIAVLSLVVGMFGVANIMFVTVRERTSQIGLKKAIGAKRGVILTEFLFESAFLCIMGGLIGLILVFTLTKIFSAALGFPIYISFNILILAISICIIVGIAAGIIPASIAARMDPVVAIRSK